MPDKSDPTWVPPVDWLKQINNLSIDQVFSEVLDPGVLVISSVPFYTPSAQFKDAFGIE